MKVAYDTTLMRPGCAIVAAGLGADTEACNAFDSRDWVTHLSPDMKVYETTPAQLERLVAKTAEFKRAKAIGDCCDEFWHCVLTAPPQTVTREDLDEHFRSAS